MDKKLYNLKQDSKLQISIESILKFLRKNNLLFRIFVI